MNYKAAKILFERMLKTPKDKLLLIREVVITGGREKMIKLDDEGNNFKFTRFIQIPSSVSLILMNPIANIINNVFKFELSDSGILFFGNNESDSGEAKSSVLRKSEFIIEADVKNHDRTVGFKEILSSGAIILRLIGDRGINFKLVCYSMSTLLKYFVYTHTGQVFRLSASMQTGNKLTSIINSIVCRLRVYIMFISDGKLMKFIHNDLNNLVIFNAGDDLIIGFLKINSKVEFSKDEFIILY
jgi:hypothetical protein